MSTPRASRVAIGLEGVRKRFGSITAVRQVTLEIREGEFFSMLGPSGCGKTTTLRLMAGFEEPDEGRILLRGVDVTGVPPNRREVNMVFQHYALFPHMSVFENVAFGLKLRRVARQEIRQRVMEMLEVVRLEGTERRRPGQLSGGQQQRVALARALVNRPTALLLDEPLGALDVKLRKEMQLELKRIQLELGTTFVYVTHDQEEALAMSDRIAIMNNGDVEQIGSGREVYERPATTFVAGFVGLLNELDVRVDEVQGDIAVMRTGDDERVVVSADDARPGDRLRIAVRPERICIEERSAPHTAHGSRLGGVIARVAYLGTFTQFHVDTSIGIRVTSHRLNDERTDMLSAGDQVFLCWGRDDAFILGGAGSSGGDVA
ncbi:MAG: ABC transporter ATP-binding protein [Actinomycetota bacterium]